MKALTFTLPDQDGKLHSLKDYLGKWVVVYFYPKDDTPGCTKEACNFRDNIQEFKKRNVEVIGISKDSVISHRKFVNKFKLNFTLLSDPDHKIIQEYGAWGRKKMMGREYDGILRNTVLINPKGEIKKEYKGINPLTHAGDLLRDLDSFQSNK